MPRTPKKDSKVRVNMRISGSLLTWAKKYAKKHKTCVTKVVVNYLEDLRAMR